MKWLHDFWITPLGLFIALMGVVLIYVGFLMATGLGDRSKRLPDLPQERTAELHHWPMTNCVFVGHRAGMNTTTGYNNVVLGHDLEPTEPANQLSIRYSDGTIFRMKLKTNVAYERP